MPDLRVRRLGENESARWPESLTRMAGFVALDSWTFFLRKVYGCNVYRLEALEDEKVVGLLVLIHVKHPIFGNYLTTAPFASYGGFAFESPAARDALLREASSLVRRLNVDYTVVRFEAGEANPPMGWQQHPVYVTFLIDLVPETETLLAGYSSNHRNHIRKSLKRGFSIRFGHLHLLDDAYEVIARSMHELGSPYHRKSYLRTMAESLGERLEFAVVFDGSGKLAGGGVFIKHGDVVNNLHANILQTYRSDYAGEFLYWSAIERYARAGLKTFDLGRSLIGSGNETFKLKWRPRWQRLAYWYALAPGKQIPVLNQKNPKFQLAIAFWKRLPRPAVRLLGSYLIRGLA